MCKLKSITYYHSRNSYYKLYVNGQIEKQDGYLSNGKSWEFLGFRKKLLFGHLSVLIPRNKIFANLEFYTDKKNSHYKNGVNRYLVVDIDHGTQRVWSC